jgi:hypothetical protein
MLHQIKAEPRSSCAWTDRPASVECLEDVGKIARINTWAIIDDANPNFVVFRVG